jgi:hypothetical protein
MFWSPARCDQSTAGAELSSARWQEPRPATPVRGNRSERGARGHVGAGRRRCPDPLHKDRLSLGVAGPCTRSPRRSRSAPFGGARRNRLRRDRVGWRCPDADATAKESQVGVEGRLRADACRLPPENPIVGHGRNDPRESAGTEGNRRPPNFLAGVISMSPWWRGRREKAAAIAAWQGLAPQCCAAASRCVVPSPPRVVASGGGGGDQRMSSICRARLMARASRRW